MQVGFYNRTGFTDTLQNNRGQIPGCFTFLRKIHNLIGLQGFVHLILNPRSNKFI